MEVAGRIAKIETKWLVLCVGFLYTIIGLVIMPSLHASADANFNSVRDCDNNAVIYCGAMNASELQQKYNASPSTQAVYNCFGITATEINDIGSAAVNGQVTSSGDVLVNGQTVATNAVTAGRQDIGASTAISCGGTTFYKRPPSVSFVSSPLDAFVVMNNGQFAYAILASCGNPVTATPVPTPAPAPAVSVPAPTPPAPTAAPAPVTPAAAPKPTTPTVLPNTGAGDVVGIFAIVTALATIGHYLWRRKFYTAK